MNYNRILIALIVALLLIVSCAGQQVGDGGDSAKTIAYKTLATAATSYDNGMKAIADMWANKTTDAQGNIIVTDAVKAKVIEYGRVYKQAYDRAITAVEAGNYDVSAVSQALADFLGYIQPYLVKGGKA